VYDPNPLVLIKACYKGNSAPKSLRLFWVFYPSALTQGEKRGVITLRDSISQSPVLSKAKELIPFLNKGEILLFPSLRSILQLKMTKEGKFIFSIGNFGN